MRKQLIVCGDSFMSPVLSFPDTHFSQIFAKKLNFELTCFSRSGMSNGGIAIQLESAMAMKPDLIIFNTTSFDRIEIPCGTNLSTLSDVPPHRPDIYTVDDLLYTQAMGLSTHHPRFNKDPKLLSMSLRDLLNLTKYDSNKDAYQNHNAMINLQFVQDLEEKVNLIKKYFMFLYDEKWKRQVDIYIMNSVIHRLQVKNIPFMWVHDPLSRHHNQEYFASWLNPKYDLRQHIGPYIGNEQYRPANFKDPGYHTTFEIQETVAQILVDYYKNNFIL